MADDGLQPAAIGITVASPCTALVFVLLRLYSRFFVKRNATWEESLIVVAMVLSIGFSTATVMAIKLHYIGYHVQDIPPMTADQNILAAKWSYASELLYNPVLAIVKNAVLIFFYRIAGLMTTLKRFIYTLIFLNTALMISIFLSTLLQCTPLRRAIDPEIPGTCIDTERFFAYSAALQLVTDVLVMGIPIRITCALHMKWRKKLGVFVLMSFGFIVTGISAYRLYYIARTYYGPPNNDPTFSLGGSASPVEVNLAIITACGPFLKPVVDKWLPNTFESNTTSPSGPGYELATIGDTNPFQINKHTRRTSIYGDGLTHMSYDLRSIECDSSQQVFKADDDSTKEIMSRGHHRGIMKSTTVDVVYSSASVEDEVSKKGYGRGERQRALYKAVILRTY